MTRKQQEEKSNPSIAVPGTVADPDGPDEESSSTWSTVARSTRRLNRLKNSERQPPSPPLTTPPSRNKLDAIIGYVSQARNTSRRVPASDPSKSYRTAVAAPMSPTVAAKLQATEDKLASVQHEQATKLASIEQSIAAMQAMMQSLMQTAAATAQAKVASSEVQTVAGAAEVSPEVSSDGGGASNASMSISSFSNLNDNTSETSSTKASPEESSDDKPFSLSTVSVEASTVYLNLPKSGLYSRGRDSHGRSTSEEKYPSPPSSPAVTSGARTTPTKSNTPPKRAAAPIPVSVGPTTGVPGDSDDDASSSEASPAPPPKPKSKPKKKKSVSFSPSSASVSPSSASSSAGGSSPESKSDIKARRNAEQTAKRAERETKTLAANYQLVKAVTDNMPKLADNNYEAWRRAWDKEFNSLGWDKDYMVLEGKDLNLNNEKGTMKVHRTNAAKMVMKTISSDHELWLRDIDQTNPQTIFRRMHKKFRGSENLGLAATIEAQLFTMTMATSRLNVAGYGTAMVDLMRKLKDMNSPTNEERSVGLYLLGLSKVFDHKRFELQKLIADKHHDAPTTMAAVKQAVEDWAVNMGPTRGLVNHVEKSNNGTSSTPVLTLLGITRTGSDATTTDKNCRTWVRHGKCRLHDSGICKWEHNIRRKGVNAPTQKDAHDAALKKRVSYDSSSKDFSKIHCTNCKLDGHSANWSKCPTTLKKRAAAKIMNVQTTTTPAPSVAILSGLEQQMIAFNKNMVNVMAMMAKGNRKASGNPLLSRDDDDE